MQSLCLAPPFAVDPDDMEMMKVPPPDTDSEYTGTYPRHVSALHRSATETTNQSCDRHHVNMVENRLVVFVIPNPTLCMFGIP